jgi:hypothetical protein
LALCKYLGGLGSSEGEKQAAILQAEARLEAAKRDAAAQITLASGASEAIKKVTAAISDRDLPAYFLLGERYITAIKDLAASPGSKTVLLPADLIQAILKVSWAEAVRSGASINYDGSPLNPWLDLRIVPARRPINDAMHPLVGNNAVRNLAVSPSPQR